MHRPKIFLYSSYLSMTLKVLPISCRKGRQIQILTPFNLQRPVWLKPHTMSSHCSSLDASAQTDKYFCFCEPYPWVCVRRWSRFLFGVRLGGGLGGLPTSLWCSVQVASQWSAFAQTPRFLLLAFQKWQLGFLVSVSFGSRICSNCTRLFLVPYNFFVFFSWWGGVFRCKLCSTAAKSPRPVSKSKKASTGSTLSTLGIENCLWDFLFKNTLLHCWWECKLV